MAQMHRMILTRPITIRGRKYEPGEEVTVSKHVARAMQARSEARLAEPQSASSEATVSLAPPLAGQARRSPPKRGGRKLVEDNDKGASL